MMSAEMESNVGDLLAKCYSQRPKRQARITPAPSVMENEFEEAALEEGV